MQICFSARSIAPDLTILSSRDDVVEFLKENNIVSEPELLFIQSNIDQPSFVYSELLTLAKESEQFSQFFYELPFAESRDVVINNPFIRSHDGAEFTNSVSFQSPGRCHIKFKIKVNDSGTKSLYITSFYPGYIDAGLVGVSSAILDQIYSIGTDN
ncbi:MAG: hypothetical protein ACRCXZ_06620, partial [Patescibacteria group bacterium]